MAKLDGVGFHFKESMSGFLTPGESDPRRGAELGRQNKATARFDVEIRIGDLGSFLRLPEHTARLSGTVTIPSLGGTFPVRDGIFNLFSVSPATGHRRMVYRFRFTASDGATYFLDGHKDIYDDRGKIDVVEDMTRLFTLVHRGEDSSAAVYGAGELYFRLLDAPALVASIKVEGAASWQQALAARTAFASFAFGALKNEYLSDVRLFYETQYENLVLSGTLQTPGGAGQDYLFVSGTHDKGFPWGDGELFWDVLFAAGDRRFAITDRVLEGLELDVSAGVYRYQGPLFELAHGYAASFSEMRGNAAALVRCDADIELRFRARPFDTVSFPFPLVGEHVRRLSSAMAKALRDGLPGEQPLGINITPHTVDVLSGRFRISTPDGAVTEWTISPDSSFGEAEHGAFRNLKEPTLLYGYLCAVRPGARSTRVQILSRTLRNERQDWVKDRLDAFLGTVVSRASSAEILVERDRLSVRPLAPAGRPSDRAAPLQKTGPPVLEVNNDHFPTAVFQRRIVEVLDPSGARSLALEEDMSLMRLEPVHSDREVTVASMRDPNKLAALDQVLDATGFDALVEARLAASGQPRERFRIAIKPNFMFAYDKHDHSTYTDPELVAHLAGRLRRRGFESIQVVEAQSTYGEFFDKRSVVEVAAYLGYDPAAGFQVVDMTEDAVEEQELGPRLGRHPVSSAWRDAGFRISFAKNKTHAYSYYTLCLKNIYGALPKANKFKEYHCNRDIYETTMEYLAAFPVDYGLIDAHLSADGPFGVFADPAPNVTETIIGGADLVAVDWVGATKMGIDPMVSRHMELAVQRFGKPRIQLVGDPTPYRPWLNVPAALTLFTSKGMDAEYHFGNLLYSVAAQMDETHFRHKSNALYIKLLRRLTVPLRQTFFVRTGENPTVLNRIASWALYRMGY